MSFLFPAFLAGALAAAIPVVLHLARRAAPPRMPFSDVRFLQRAPLLQARRRRIRERLLLALRIAALLLLALAFARPFVDATGLSGRPVTMVALDRSFSLSPETFARARDEARAAIAEAPADDLVGLVTFDDRAAVVAAPALDRSGAVAALARATPGFGATRYEAAIDAAAEAIGARGGRIVVVTDLQRAGWAGVAGGSAPPGVAVRIRDVGPAGGNLAVTAIEVEPLGAAGVVTDVVAHVANLAPRTNPPNVPDGANPAAGGRSAAVRLRIDGALVDAAEVRLPPGSTRVAFDVELPPAGVLAVTVDDPGGLPADDRRYHLLDRPEPLPVVVVTVGGPGGGAFYLERALLAAGDASRYRVRSLAPPAVSTATLDGAAVVVLVATAGLDRSGRRQLAAFVESGGGLLIAAGPQLDPHLLTGLPAGPASDPSAEPPGADPVLGAAPAAGDGPRRWSVTAARHPLFAAFGGLAGALGQVRFRRTVRFDAGQGRVLAMFSDGTPALLERAVGRGRVLLFASDLNNVWNDFPRQPTFVPFVHEALRYLGGDPAPERSLLVADAPPGVAPVPGAATDPASGRAIVLNVDPRESDPSRLTTQEFESRISRPSAAESAPAAASAGAAGREAEQDWWWYALLAMAVALVAESWLGRTAA